MLPWLQNIVYFLWVCMSKYRSDLKDTSNKLNYVFGRPSSTSRLGKVSIRLDEGETSSLISIDLNLWMYECFFMKFKTKQKKTTKKFLFPE